MPALELNALIDATLSLIPPLSELSHFSLSIPRTGEARLFSGPLSVYRHSHFGAKKKSIGRLSLVAV